MLMNLSQLRNSLSSFGRWMKDQIVTDVPDDLGVCEFECRKSECPSSKWDRCQRRVSKSAAGLGNVVTEQESPDISASVESTPTMENVA